LNADAERQASAIQLRAERKAGDLLAKMYKTKGIRPAGKETDGNYRRSQDATAEMLSALDISKIQSSRW
jgi:regulator of protease activity HflC (stomatin/prohibitin superfamily)